MLKEATIGQGHVNSGQEVNVGERAGESLVNMGLAEEIAPESTTSDEEDDDGEEQEQEELQADTPPVSNPTRTNTPQREAPSEQKTTRPETKTVPPSKPRTE